MKILRIVTDNGQLRFDLDFAGDVHVRAYRSAFCTDTPIFEIDATAQNGYFTLPLDMGGCDGRFLYYLCSAEGKEIDGAKYAEDM
ncbi:MAG: hypothetical protein J6V39_05060, partial [Clostridia bacterium]|nr:hypothetical protein [Clostridia bacterium]